jgi:hypothetical protein
MQEKQYKVVSHPASRSGVAQGPTQHSSSPTFATIHIALTPQSSNLHNTKSNCTKLERATRRHGGGGAGAVAATALGLALLARFEDGQRCAFDELWLCDGRNGCVGLGCGRGRCKGESREEEC